MKAIYAIIAVIAIIGTASASIPMSIGTQIGTTYQDANGKVVVIASNNGYVIDATFPAYADIHRPEVAKAIANMIVEINSKVYEIAKEQGVSTDIIYDGNTPVEVRIYIESTRAMTYTTDNAFNGTFTERVEAIQAVIDASA